MSYHVDPFLTALYISLVSFVQRFSYECDVWSVLGFYAGDCSINQKNVFSFKDWFEYIMHSTRNALFENALSAIPENELAMPMPRSQILFLAKSSSHMYISICMYTFMKSSFPKHVLRIWHWHCNFDFWIDTYRVFEKSSSHLFK